MWIGCAYKRLWFKWQIDVVHIGERVRGGDAPERVGVIDDRWKEIRRHDQGAVVADLHDARILVGLEANKEIGVRGLLFVSQDLGEAAGINLGRSAATGGVVRKPDPSCDAHVFSREVRGRS